MKISRNILETAYGNPAVDATQTAAVCHNATWLENSLRSGSGPLSLPQQTSSKTH